MSRLARSGILWLALTVATLAAAGAGEPRLVESAAAGGLDFVHFNGMTGELYFAEMMGGGAALLDYDRDGDLDLYLVQGEMLDGSPPEGAIFPPRRLPLSDRLYRNDLAGAAGGGAAPRWTDVSAAARIPPGGYGMGATSADFDNDGWPDLYVTNFGVNRLLRNLGDGTFRDVTAAAGVGDPSWSVAASFFDYDRDGLLDLFVGNYVAYRLATHRTCISESGAADYCGPQAYPAEPDRLYRNLGGGRFEEVTRRAGLDAAYGPALGSVAADLDADGWLDLYVANDQAPNQMWINRGDGTFGDQAVISGTAVNREGRPEASMGVVAADLDGDGRDDLFLSHLARETNTLYLSSGDGFFDDASGASGLGAPSWRQTGFGVGLLDFDLDGDFDLLVANGAVKLIEGQALAGDPLPLRQPDQLFENLGGGRFREVAAGREAGLEAAGVGRGVAVGDLDNDGDPDAVIVDNAGPVRLLANHGAGGSWVGLSLLGPGGRDLLGAAVTVRTAAGGALRRRLAVDGSYAASGDPRVVAGLGPGGAAARLEWRSPDGAAGRLLAPPVERYLVLPAGDRR